MSKKGFSKTIAKLDGNHVPKREELAMGFTLQGLMLSLAIDNLAKLNGVSYTKQQELLQSELTKLMEEENKEKVDELLSNLYADTQKVS